MFVVGLTGGIGSGKTAASNWFAEKGIHIVDADVLARQVVAKGESALAKIRQHFGDWVLSPVGELNRAALREYIFTHPEARAELEAITHPAIYQAAQIQLSQAQSVYTLIVAPLLLEGGDKGLKRYCQRILVVDAPESVQLERAAKRDAKKTEQIQKIIDAQMSRMERLKWADDVVDSSKDLPHLYQQLEKLHQKYSQLAAH